MKRKTAGDVLHEANPELNIIPGGVHRRGRRKKAIRFDEVSHVEMPIYIPHRTTEEDWNAAGGLNCPRCNNDTVKLVPIGLTGKHKICPECVQRRRRLIALKSRLLDYRRRAAMVNRK